MALMGGAEWPRCYLCWGKEVDELESYACKVGLC